MPLVAIGQIRNEEDIIEEFVRHTCTFADILHIVLHNSTDETGNIIQSLIEEGLPILCDTFVHRDHVQNETLTRLMHLYAQQDAFEWILPLDADEFLWSDSCSISTALKHLDPSHIVHLQWRTYMPNSKKNVQESHLAECTNRREKEGHRSSKVLIPIHIAKQSTVELRMGNHNLIDTESGMILPAQQISDLYLIHLPVRSEDQIRRKIINGWESTMYKEKKTPNEAHHWKQIYERMRSNEPIDDEELLHIALWYGWKEKDPPKLIHDPLLPLHKDV